jgi:hypothetical protein
MLRGAVVVGLWWAGSGAALAAEGCPDLPVQAVRQAAADLTLAWIAADEAAGLEPIDTLQAAVPCLDKPLSAHDLIGLHRAMAIAAYYVGDVHQAGRSWAAVRQLDPGWDPPPSLLPRGTEPYRLFAEAPAEPGELVRLSQAAPSHWEVDGVRGDAVPENRAFLLMAFGLDGVVQHAGYYGDVEQVPVLDFTPVGRARRQVRAWGTAGAVAVGAGAAVAGALALGTRAAILDESTPLSELRSLERQNAAQVGVAAALGATAGAGMVVAWAVPWGRTE